MFDDFIERARSGVAELDSLDPERRLFGAGSHAYRIGATVPEATLSQLESRWEFRAPAAYRAFMLHVGDGGAGPAYGVLPFGQVDDGFGFTAWESWGLRPGAPFPHRAAWNDTTLLDEGAPIRGEFPDDSSFQAAHDAWWRSEAPGEARDAYFEGLATQLGCLPICHHGCGIRDWLVVTGPEAGHVWHDSGVDEGGIAPVRFGDLDRVTFDTWWLHWLDESLRELRTSGL